METTMNFSEKGGNVPQTSRIHWGSLARRFCIYLLLPAAAILLMGCDDDDDSFPRTYTITDAGGRLVVNSGVSVIHVDISGTCQSFAPGPSIVHTGDADVTTNGSVVLSFSVGFGDAYVESIYLDQDNSNTLTNGDWVWGTNPTDLGGVCIESAASFTGEQSFDWENDVALDAQLGFGGSIQWSGGAQTFGAAGESSQIRFGTIVPLPAGRY